MNLTFRYGGLTFNEQEGTSTATVWYNNKGWHALPAYYNALSNTVLRANINMTHQGDSQEYGKWITHYISGLLVYRMSFVKQ